MNTPARRKAGRVLASPAAEQGSCPAARCKTRIAARRGRRPFNPPAEACARILRVLRETGGRVRNVLDGLAGGDRRVVNALVRDGLVKIRGTRKGALYEAAA
jgi:hypothetical protein